jgi:hypothetical protein
MSEVATVGKNPRNIILALAAELDNLIASVHILLMDGMYKPQRR